jgi:2,4-dienoyl-CoA reductase-like NADH-dependent reductase (Old Yellow Enzyme family)
MKSEFLYLHHIRERCERIAGCVRAGRGTFLGDVVYQDAVLRNLEVIGEAAKRVSAEMRAQLLHPFRRMASKSGLPGTTRNKKSSYAGRRTRHQHGMSGRVQPNRIGFPGTTG